MYFFQILKSLLALWDVIVNKYGWMWGISLQQNTSEQRETDVLESEHGLQVLKAIHYLCYLNGFWASTVHIAWLGIGRTVMNKVGF